MNEMNQFHYVGMLFPFAVCAGPISNANIENRFPFSDDFSSSMLISKLKRNSCLKNKNERKLKTKMKMLKVDEAITIWSELGAELSMK